MTTDNGARLVARMRKAAWQRGQDPDALSAAEWTTLRRYVTEEHPNLAQYATRRTTTTAPVVQEAISGLHARRRERAEKMATVSAEVARRVEQRLKQNPAEDYAGALHAVLDADPTLKTAYTRG